MQERGGKRGAMVALVLEDDLGQGDRGQVFAGGGVDGVEKAFKLMEGQAQAITRSAERLQTTAEQTGRGIQETYTAVVEKMKGVYQS